MLSSKRNFRRTFHTSKLLTVLLGLVLFAAVAGCGAGSGSNQDVLKVGIIAPLSGALAEDGTAYANAAQAALKAAEKDLDMKIKVVKYDEASKTAEAVTGTRRLIQSDRVDVLLSGSTSGNFLATRQIIDQAKIPVLTIATATAVVEGNAAGWTFRLSQPLEKRNKDNAEFAIKELGAKSAAFLQVNDESQRVFVKVVSDELTAQGVDVVSKQFFQYNDIDFSPYIQKMRSPAPDVTFLGCEVTQCATIIDQAHTAGIDTDFMLPTAASSDDFLKSFGKASDGSYVQTVYAPGAVNTTAEFEKVAKAEKFPASYYSIIGFSEAQVLAGAVKQAGSTEPKLIKETLAKGTFKSALGDITFLDNGQADIPGYVAQVIGSKYVYKWPKG